MHSGRQRRHAERATSILAPPPQEQSMQIGASLPVGDIGTGRAVLRDYGQAIEGLGFDYIITGDHVMGANPAKPKPEGVRVGTTSKPCMTRSWC
jgi:hypothetical protein